ncbi:unnamed protein product [Amoebophrya sp. A120]|nr:unnamed protein product [Amoebophrya sp. A120]|eukprot:GSA120T00010246001.1
MPDETETMLAAGGDALTTVAARQQMERRTEKRTSPEVAAAPLSCCSLTEQDEASTQQVKRKMLSLVFPRLKTQCSDKILLGFKKRGFGKGKWNGFGGKFEEGKDRTIRDCAARELLEECPGLLTVLDDVPDCSPLLVECPAAGTRTSTGGEVNVSVVQEKVAAELRFVGRQDVDYLYEKGQEVERSCRKILEIFIFEYRIDHADVDQVQDSDAGDSRQGNENRVEKARWSEADLQTLEAHESDEMRPQWFDVTTELGKIGRFEEDERGKCVMKADPVEGPASTRNAPASAPSRARDDSIFSKMWVDARHWLPGYLRRDCNRSGLGPADQEEHLKAKKTRMDNSVVEKSERGNMALGSCSSRDNTTMNLEADFAGGRDPVDHQRSRPGAEGHAQAEREDKSRATSFLRLLYDRISTAESVGVDSSIEGVREAPGYRSGADPFRIYTEPICDPFFARFTIVDTEGMNSEIVTRAEMYEVQDADHQSCADP